MYFEYIFHFINDIIGRLPEYIGMPTITLPDNLQRRTLVKFKVGDVLKIQCKGEIENTDLLSREVNVISFFLFCKILYQSNDSC